MTCDHCDDGEGNSVYPYYGLAPHTHKNGPMAGSTIIDPKENWPDNFSEDDECPGLGIYTHCLNCGEKS